MPLGTQNPQIILTTLQYKTQTHWHMGKGLSYGNKSGYWRTGKQEYWIWPMGHHSTLKGGKHWDAMVWTSLKNTALSLRGHPQRIHLHELPKPGKSGGTGIRQMLGSIRETVGWEGLLRGTGLAGRRIKARWNQHDGCTTFRIYWEKGNWTLKGRTYHSMWRPS